MYAGHFAAGMALKGRVPKTWGRIQVGRPNLPREESYPWIQVSLESASTVLDWDNRGS